MRLLAISSLALLLALGCRRDGEPRAASFTNTAMAKWSASRDDGTAVATDAAMPKRRARGTKITLGGSEFGSMLFDSRRRAMYIFENDPPRKTVCYGQCAQAWPPVYTNGRPRAGRGVRASLLGTVLRRDGRRQVTYAGKPLYFYAHEEPGEVLCHNMDLNGGLWWVVGPNGRRRP
jgi:predicted lipoprotein with Yx(FWY)xxD motif